MRRACCLTEGWPKFKLNEIMQSRHIIRRVSDFLEYFQTLLLQRSGPAMSRCLLFVELGARASRALRRGFAAEGFRIDSALGVRHAQAMAAMRRYDARILFSETVELLARYPLRSDIDVNADKTPLICVADLTEDDEVRLLNAGASLCVPPAIPFAEMLARLRALIDIAEGFPRHYRISDLGIDPVARRASRAGVPLSLRPREFDLLIYLAERAGRPVSGEELHHAFWPRRTFSGVRIAVQIHNLRCAIGKARQAPLLHTIRPDGYVLSGAPPRRQRNTPKADPRGRQAPCGVC